MKTLYIECKMGAAGDMLTGALLELLPEQKQQEALIFLQKAGIEGVQISTEKMSKCGIQGTHVQVLVDGIEEESLDAGHHHEHYHDEHQHNHQEHHHHEEKTSEHVHEHHKKHHEHHKLSDIVDIIRNIDISEAVKNDIIAVYNLIAEAESHAHGVSVDQIHFHEVGNKDAIMDITAVCYLINLIGAEKIIASPVHVGSGSVHCAHGIMPVPAPATEYLLRGIPYYQGNINSELCTPTGAALLKYFAQSFGPQPLMIIEKTGIGCGKKDFEAANCVRVFLGETVESSLTDRIIQLDANVDDMTAEEIGFAMDRLFDAGAREVFTSPVYMKKNRPGTMISVICSEDKKEIIIRTFFKHTTTIGIRQKICDRYILERQICEIDTEFGKIEKKVSSGYDCKREKFEYEDMTRIALEKDLSLREIRKLLEK